LSKVDFSEIFLCVVGQKSVFFGLALCILSATSDRPDSHDGWKKGKGIPPSFQLFLTPFDEQSIFSTPLAA
jgi:hypothetical protein